MHSAPDQPAASAGSAQTQLLLRPATAARLLDISRSTLYVLMAAGSIESISVGRSRRIPYQSLAAWVEQQRAAQRAAGQS